MPNYEYRCTSCTHQWTQGRSIADRDKDIFCPVCVNPYVVRVFTTQNTAVIFKTGGFYTTDSKDKK